MNKIVEECKCCKENSDLLAETFIVAIKCITYNEDFKLLCLNKTTKLCSKLLVPSSKIRKQVYRHLKTS